MPWWDEEDQFGVGNRFSFDSRVKPKNPFSLDDRFSFDSGNGFSRGTNIQEPFADLGPGPGIQPGNPARPKSAYDRFMEISNEQPIKGDKQYERGNWGKLGAVLAGAAYGGLTKDPGAGVALGSHILDSKYEKAYGDWASRFKPAKEAAIQELNQVKEARAARKEEADTKLTEAQTKEKEIELETLREEKKAEVRSKLATAGYNEARAKQITDDMENPDLLKEPDNKGGLNFFNKKTGKLVNNIPDFNVSEADLKKIDLTNDLKKIGATGAQQRLNIRDQGLQDMKEIGVRDANQQRLEGLKFFFDDKLQRDRLTNQGRLQEDRQAFQLTNPTQASNRLNDPQFKREFKVSMDTLAAEDPGNAKKIKELFDIDDKGNIIPAEDVDMSEYLRVFNLISSNIKTRTGSR